MWSRNTTTKWQKRDLNLSLLDLRPHALAPGSTVLVLGTVVTPPPGPKLTTCSLPEAASLWPVACDWFLRGHSSMCLISSVTQFLSELSLFLSFTFWSFLRASPYESSWSSLCCRKPVSAPPSPRSDSGSEAKHQWIWWLLNRVPSWELKERAPERVGQLHLYYTITPCIALVEQG